MQTKEFTEYAELLSFVEELLKSKKYAVLVDQLPNGYKAKWVELKSYTAQDGQTYTDEVWETKEGEMIAIQDLAPEHARNIIRMILRRERENRAALQQILAEAAQAAATDLEEDQVLLDEDMESLPNNILPNYINGNKTVH